MAKKKLACVECESEFSVSHDMDKKHYAPQFCVFCGAAIDEDAGLDEDFLEETDE